MKSPLHSPNPCSFSSYKIRKNNPLHLQHLRHPLVSAHSKGTSTPLDSAVTRPLSLTPVQSTLTKNGGRGVGQLWLTKIHFACSLSRRATIIPPRILNRRLSCPSEPHSTNALSPSAKASIIASGPATTPSVSTRRTTSTSTTLSAIPPRSSTFLRSTNIASPAPTPRAS